MAMLVPRSAWHVARPLRAARPMPGATRTPRENLEFPGLARGQRTQRSGAKPGIDCALWNSGRTDGGSGAGNAPWSLPSARFAHARCNAQRPVSPTREARTRQCCTCPERRRGGSLAAHPLPPFEPSGGPGARHAALDRRSSRAAHIVRPGPCHGGRPGAREIRRTRAAPGARGARLRHATAYRRSTGACRARWLHALPA